MGKDKTVKDLCRQAIITGDDILLAVYSFDSSPIGRLSHAVWSKEDKDKTYLTSQTLLKGMRIFLRPGMMLTLLFSDGTVKQIAGNKQMAKEVANKKVKPLYTKGGI